MKGHATPVHVLLIGILFTVIGIAIMVTPTKTLLKIDRHTGYGLYKWAPDEHSGQRQAGCFYMLFGLTFTCVGLGAIFVALLGIIGGTSPF